MNQREHERDFGAAESNIEACSSLKDEIVIVNHL